MHNPLTHRKFDHTAITIDASQWSPSTIAVGTSFYRRPFSLKRISITKLKLQKTCLFLAFFMTLFTFFFLLDSLFWRPRCTLEKDVTLKPFTTFSSNFTETNTDGTKHRRTTPTKQKGNHSSHLKVIGDAILELEPDDTTLLGTGVDNINDPRYINTTHLIIVPAHGVFNGWNMREWSDYTKWSFQPYLISSKVDVELANKLAGPNVQGMVTPSQALVLSITEHMKEGLRAMLFTPGESGNWMPKRKKGDNISKEQQNDDISRNFSRPSVNIKDGNNNYENLTTKTGHFVPSFTDANFNLQSSLLIFSGGATGGGGVVPIEKSEGLSYLGVVEEANYFKVFDSENDGLFLAGNDNAVAFKKENILHNSTKERSRINIAAIDDHHETLNIIDEKTIGSEGNTSASFPNTIPTFDHIKHLAKHHIFVEDYARDSYENLLFSIARFYEVTGRYPTFITVAGFKYKCERFTEYHRKAIKFRASNFFCMGVDPREALERAHVQVDISHTYLEVDTNQQVVMSLVNNSFATSQEDTIKEINDGNATTAILRKNTVDMNSEHAHYMANKPNRSSSISTSATTSQLPTTTTKTPITSATNNKAKKLNPATYNGTALYKLLHPHDYSLSRVAEDLYLCFVNRATRLSLNSMRKANPYQLSAPQMGPLLRYCSRTEIFPSMVPWDEDTGAVGN